MKPADPNSLKERIADLQRTSAYAQRPPRVDFLQTHISLLFFAGQRVYKLKKSVELGFLDFSTLALRKHFCEEEVRLNRRLAPAIYLGVVPIRRGADGRLWVDAEGTGGGAIEDWAVEMVRLPAARMFGTLLDAGQVDNSQLRALIALLVKFYADCPTGAGVDEFGSVGAIRANVEENFAQLAPYVGPKGAAIAGGGPLLAPNLHAFLSARAAGFLRQHDALFQRRIVEGKIREGHGDLHAGNLCFTDTGVVAYDCIEFSRRFRCGDIAAELAFLCMDLDQRGYPAFGAYLAKSYALETKDPELLDLMGFYKGYRAIVRAKVAAFGAYDSSLAPERREQLRLESLGYLALATGYELPAALILMCGLPACGKSWFAERLARPLRAVLLHSDTRRKALAGLSLDTHVKAAPGQGLYSAEQKAKTYASLLEDAQRGVRAGHAVLVDATFSTRAQRAPFVEAALHLGCPLFVVHVSAEEAVIRARLAERERGASTHSDAGLAVYLAARDSFEAPTEVGSQHAIEVRSAVGSTEEQVAGVLERMAELVPRG
jgi:uncharacterized protein